MLTFNTLNYYRLIYNIFNNIYTCHLKIINNIFNIFFKLELENY